MRTWLRALALVLLAGPSVAQEPPLTLALALDTSGSVTARDRDALQAVAEAAARALPDGSEVAVFSFDDQARLVLPRTDVGKVSAVVRGLRARGRYTALYDAIYDASRYLADAPGRRKAILLVTDGKDENSALDLEDGVRMARQSRIPVYTVGVGAVQEKVLRRISKLTDGAYFGLRAPGARVAARVVELTPEVRTTAPPTPPAVPPATAAPAASPVPAASPRGGSPVVEAPGGVPRLLLWGLIGLVALGGLLLIAYAIARPAGSPASVARAAGDGPPAPPVELGDPSTMVTPLLGIEDAVRTVVLTLRPLLHTVRGTAAGRIFEVSMQAATSIGRAPGNDVVIDDKAISAQHCRIRPAEQGGFEVLDLKSTNGTFVNERRVTRHPIGPGDNLKVGQTVLQFRMDHIKNE